tara:strand:+ start:506 stop:730 length:225 start_codon:yes stop_codon:yes gene_type:complete
METIINKDNMASDIIKKRDICIKLNKESDNSWEWLLKCSEEDINEEFQYWTEEEWDKPLEYFVKTVLGEEKNNG